MTALVFALQPDQICIAMDTLVVGAEDKKPINFQRKFLFHAESNLLIAGTGLANLINGWFEYVSSFLGQSDIDDLNLLAPNVLKASVLAAGGLDYASATLYHFGYSRDEAKYAGYAYRSTADFKSERLSYGLGIKPKVHVEADENIEFPKFLIEIILEQQRQDRLLPLGKQVGIGGEIEFAMLAEGIANIETVHRFASYEAEKMFMDGREHA